MATIIFLIFLLAIVGLWITLGVMAYKEWRLPGFGTSIFWWGWVATTAFIGLFGSAGVVAYEADRQAVKIELVKADWVCTQHRETTTYVRAGQIMSPITNRVCVQYTKGSN